MKKIRIKKLNNQGSTFVLALLVITLLTTLALALANATIGNMMMKSMDRGSKKTFYTAETLLDEIRVGVGYSSLDNLARAYESVLTTLIDTSTGSASVMDNNEANTNLKEKYVDNVLGTVSGGYLVFNNSDEKYVSSELMTSNDVARIKQAAMDYIQDFIVGNGYDQDMAKVTSVGHINAYKDSNAGYKWTVILKDVAVTYKEYRGGETYFSNITADLEIEYPNMTVDFTSTNKLKDFNQYSLIANNSINIAGQKVNVNASVYAAHLIDIAATSSKGADVHFQSLSEDENITIVCGGGNSEEAGTRSGTVLVGGGNAEGVQSIAKFSGVNIWCTNIATNKKFGDASNTDATAGATIVIDNKCYSYVRDDLSVDAQKSNISIAGEYNGYMYEGGDSSLGHAASSAIIVNGRNSSVSIATKSIMLAGKAYIDVTKTIDGLYVTGESLALKGDQEVYLVPPEYLGKNYHTALTNPMSKTMWETIVTAAGQEGSNVKICELPNNYFAKGYLNKETPYVTRLVGGDMIYVYWNFETGGAAKYIKDVLAGKDTDLKNKLDRYTKNLFGGSGAGVSVSSGTSINATGVLMEASGGKASDAGSSLMNEGIFAQLSKDYDERYKIFVHLLAELPWKVGGNRYYVTGAGAALQQLRGYSVNGNELESRAIYNIVDMALLNGNQYNEEGDYIKYGPPTKNYTKMAIKTGETFNVPDDIHGGIIICDGDVNLNHSFDGLIIAKGSINITGDATITTNAAMIEELILGKEEFIDQYGELLDKDPEPVPFKQYFYAYKVGALEENSREEVKIENIDYKDLVNFNNWRRYEDK